MTENGVAADWKKMIVVGAGPIGLETALRAVSDGYDVNVLEQGDVGAAIRQWGHVRLFTPFQMNSSAAGRRALDCNVADDEILSGDQYVDRYLCPLADSTALQGKVLTQHEVVACSRETLGKSHAIGRPERADQPFRILTRTPAGERLFHADVLIDCTGFVSLHRWVGAGGIPCLGETAALQPSNYRIPDVAGSERADFANRRTLVIGSGYSAATSINDLRAVANAAPDTRVTWVTRGDRSQPLIPVVGDPLSERERLTSSANTAVADDWCRWLPGYQIEAMRREADGVHVSLKEPSASECEEIIVDRVIANPGFRPNGRPFEELQVHRCYATDGPMKHAAYLLGESSGDCLTQESGGAGVLKNPEPNFYILGAAGYGRDSRFLLQTGLQQVTDLFDALRDQTL